jgi:hypothetical protein
MSLSEFFSDSPPGKDSFLPFFVTDVILEVDNGAENLKLLDDYEALVIDTR